MCGRYYIEIEEVELRLIIDEVTRNLGKDVKTGEIYPTNTAPVLTLQNNEIKPTVMDWGFPNFRNKGVIINARSETALEKRTFKEAVLSRRCVIPSSGFFEWKENGTKKKDKYLFTLPKSSILYMAGLYTSYEIDGVKDNRFVILTTAANSSMQEVHDRMPLILTKDNMESWVGNTETAINMLQIVPPSLDMKFV